MREQNCSNCYYGDWRVGVTQKCKECVGFSNWVWEGGIRHVQVTEKGAGHDK